MSFTYVNSVSAQRWYGINVKDYSISAQRWYRIELKVLVVVFSDKDLHVVLFDRTKENELSTCDSERKKVIAWESVFSLKNDLKRKVLMDVDPRKEDRAIRDRFLEMPLVYYLLRRVHFEFNQSCDKSYMFNLTNDGLSMCVMEYSDLFLNLVRTNPDIYV